MPTIAFTTRLQQGFATSEMRLNRHFAWQQSSEPSVRFGSKADMTRCDGDVRFTPKSGHWQTTVGCPLCAKSGLMHCSKKVYSITSSAATSKALRDGEAERR
jgi:hypothetical protein